MPRRPQAVRPTPVAVGGVPLGANGANMAGDANFLSRQMPSDADNSFTVSCWHRYDVDAAQSAWSSGPNVSGSLQEYFRGSIYRWQMVSVNGPLNISTGSVLDLSQSLDTWFHYTLNVNPPGALCTLWRDNVEIWSETWLQDGQSLWTDSSVAQFISALVPTSSFPGMTGDYYDFRYVDGLLLLPTEFGYDDGGNWRPLAYDGPFGPHGFALQFDDPGNMGLNGVSGGQDWIVNGTATQVSDPPT